MPERHVEPLGRLRELALNGSEPSTLGVHARLLGGEHAGDFRGLRAAEALARLHHVFGRERSAELCLGLLDLEIVPRPGTAGLVPIRNDLPDRLRDDGAERLGTMPCSTTMTADALFIWLRK